MKAAMMFGQDALPRYADIPEPVAQNEDEILIRVKAVAIKHFDKSRASGKHYSSHKPGDEGRVLGSDGVGELEDGTRVYGIGISGMLSEKALIEKDRMVKVPNGLSDAIAAALPNAVIGSAMGLRFKAGIREGDTVLINGATGVTGRVAVQVAKYYGAGKVVVTGRDRRSLEDLLLLGADETIGLDGDDGKFENSLKALQTTTPIDIVIDHLWGRTAEMILACLKGQGNFTHRTRYVSVGSVTGDVIQLSAANLRSADLQLSGSGLGSWSKEQVRSLFSEILPEMFLLAADGKLKMEVVEVRLPDISDMAKLDVPNGKRLVVTV